jgi:hypothetical protein
MAVGTANRPRRNHVAPKLTGTAPESFKYRGGVHTERRDVLHSDARMRSHHVLLTSAALGALIVVAAGMSGTIHFAGPRWVPHLKLPTNKQTPAKVRASPTGAPLRIKPSHGTDRFPLGSVLLWILIGIAVIGVALQLWKWWNRRPLREAPGQHSVVARETTEIPIEPEPELEPDTPALRSGIELALEMLDEQREPADAIVRAWLGLQETAEESGIVRQPAETATEFTSRILSRAVVDDRAVRTLLRLYLRTRFGDHPVTSDDVAAVRMALQELVRTWPASEARAEVGRR